MKTNYLYLAYGIILLVLNPGCFAQNELNSRTIRTRDLKTMAVKDTLPPAPPKPASPIPPPPPPPESEHSSGCGIRPCWPTLPHYPACLAIKDYAKRRACAQNIMMEFVYENLKWPPLALSACVTGTGVIRFVVEKDGLLSNFEIARDIGGCCGEEALRVIKMLPDFIPGTQNGKPVSVQYNFPVRFRLN